MLDANPRCNPNLCYLTSQILQKQLLPEEAITIADKVPNPNPTSNPNPTPNPKVHSLEYEAAEMRAVEMFDTEMLNHLSSLVTPDHRRSHYHRAYISDPNLNPTSNPEPWFGRLLLEDLQKETI